MLVAIVLHLLSQGLTFAQEGIFVVLGFGVPPQRGKVLCHHPLLPKHQQLVADPKRTDNKACESSNENDSEYTRRKRRGAHCALDSGLQTTVAFDPASLHAWEFWHGVIGGTVGGVRVSVRECGQQDRQNPDKLLLFFF